MIDPQICTKCKTRNPMGNKFCRECGNALPLPENPLLREEFERAEAERRQEHAAQLLAEAYKTLEAGKHLAAIRFAEQSVELLPESMTALSLLASLYQRVGQQENAVATMEKIVALYPESATEKTRLEQMRRGIPVLPPPQPETADDERPAAPWLPLAAAGVAAALVFVLLLTLTRNREEQSSPQTARRPQPQGFLPYTQSPVTSAPPSGMAAAPGYYLPTPKITPFPLSALNSPSPPPRARQRERPRRSVSATSGREMTLPLPGQLPQGETEGPVTGSEAGMVAPVTLPPPPENSGTFGSGGRLSVGPPGPSNPSSSSGSSGSANSPGPGEAKTTGGSYIRIRVAPGNTNTPPAPDTPAPAPGNSLEPPGEGTEAPDTRSTESESAPLVSSALTRARRFQAEGRYPEAVLAYKEAIGQGMPTGDAYLGIAQCYQRTGNKGQARGAYQEAIRAYEAQILVGRSPAPARQGIATCRAALDLIEG